MAQALHLVSAICFTLNFTVMKMLILVAAVLFFISLAFKSALSSIHYPSSGIQLPVVEIYASKIAANTAVFTATPWQPAGC